VTAQLDLFAEDEHAVLAAKRAEWSARFERVEIPSPWDCQFGGPKKGDPVLGWRCPSCLDVEMRTYALVVNHGYDPDVPGREPRYDNVRGRCYKTALRLAFLLRETT
jgi:hypothetical protein